MLIVKVKWLDASFYDDYLNDKKMAEALEEEYILETVGHLIAINDKAVILSDERIPPDNRFRRAHRIPTAYIKEVTILDDDGVSDTSPNPALLSRLPVVRKGNGKRVRADGRKRKQRGPGRSRGARRG